MACQLSDEQERDSVEAWQTSRKYATLYGEIPTSFTTLVRSLLADQETGGQFSSGSEWQMLRLLRTASMKGPFYFALKTFLPEAIDEPAKSLKELLHRFQARDVAGFLGLLYLYRRAKRLCNADEFERLTEQFHTQVEVAGHVGIAMPNIGFPLAVFSLSLPVLSRAAFLIHDCKGFAAYRRQCKISKIPYDFEYEFGRWSCTHVQITSNLAVAVGFSAEFAHALSRGLAQKELGDEKANKVAYATQICKLWTDALLENGKEPDIVHSGNFYPSQTALERLLAACERVRQNGSAHEWLEKGKDSVNCEDMPELFK